MEIIILVEIDPTKASLKLIFIESLYGANLYRRVSPRININGGIIPETKFINQVNSSREKDEFISLKIFSSRSKIPPEYIFNKNIKSTIKIRTKVYKNPNILFFIIEWLSSIP